MKILVTGGASGLGRAITVRLAKDIHNTVYFTYNTSVEKALDLEREFPNVKAFQVDFRLDESVEAFVNKMKDIEPLVLINNAINGYSEKHFHKIEPTLFESSFKVNICPVLRITQEFISLSRKRKSGKIITILTSYILNKPPIGLAEYVGKAHQ